MDIKIRLKKKPLTKFEEYLRLHKKKISLFWHKDGESSINEFIIIDDSAYVTSDDKNINISFSTDEISKKTSEFKNIGVKSTTSAFFDSQFFDSYLEPKIKADSSFTDDDRKSIIKYLKSIV
jgi:hypothetical protein